MDNIADIYELSPMQQGMLFHALAAPGAGLYYQRLSCTLQGRLDAQTFKKSWQWLVHRHASLRTAFFWEDADKPLQVVFHNADLPWVEEDWRHWSSTEQCEQLDRLSRADRKGGFDLTRAPLMRCALRRLREDVWHFEWCHHHLLLDGWCLPILLRELFAAYGAFVGGGDCGLPLTRPYRDYIDWLQRQDGAPAKSFWRTQLKGFTTPTPLGVERTGNHPSAASGGDAHIERIVSTRLAEALNRLVRNCHVTTSTLAQAAWSLLLHHYSGEDDVVFGVTVSGRPATLAGVDSMVGLFINTVPVRVRIQPDLPLSTFLRKLMQQHGERDNHGLSSLAEIQSWSDVRGGVPLFNTLVVVENYPVGINLGEPADNLVIGDFRFEEKTNYPVTLVVVPGPPLRLEICYDSDRFDQATVERMLGHVVGLLEDMARDPQRRLDELSLLGAAERRRLLRSRAITESMPGGRQSLSPSAAEASSCLHERFEAVVRQTPEASAVTWEMHDLTYRELNERANQVAHFLRKLGVGPERLVGICLERCSDLVSAMLGVLKAGGAYVPLDPSYPAGRLQFMLKDANVAVLLTQRALLPRLPRWRHLRVVCLDAERDSLDRESRRDPPPSATTHNAAYVIYTSGSTGRPKGVVLTHGNVTRLFSATQSWFHFGAVDVWTLFHSFAFDFSVWEVWGALLYGGRLVIVPYEISRSPHDFYELLWRQRVTVLNQTPSAFRELMEVDTAAGAGSCLSLRWVIFGGEALNIPSLRPWFDRHGDQIPQLVNMYGITETTVHVTYRPLTVRDLGSSASVIGVPIPDLQVYVLNRYFQPVPVGVPGELYVGGAGVARGYLNRAALTAERFNPHPFSEVEGARLYRTGDQGRLLSNGEIEYLGRIDNQVKIRGFRLEPGEIESRLREHPAVKEAVVILRNDSGGEPHLVAYVVPQTPWLPARVPSAKENGPDQPSSPPEVNVSAVTRASTAELDSSDLRAFLLKQLPGYMTPAVYVTVDALPRTPHGKLDRSALPEFDGRRLPLGQRLTLPETSTERAVLEAWKEVLHTDEIGIDDNFFDLGGHSLLIVRLHGKLRRAVDQDFPIVSLFTYPTVHSFARFLSQENEVAMPADSSDRAAARRAQDTGRNRLREIRQNRREQASK